MSTFINAGSISTNLFNRFQEFGFKKINCLVELIDNCLDAEANQIYLILEPINDEKHRFHILDNGTGLTTKQMVKFYEIAADKDESDLKDKNPIGSKGMGGKIAMINLTNKGYTQIISKTKDSWNESKFDWNSNTYFNNVPILPEKTVSGENLVNQSGEGSTSGHSCDFTQNVSKRRLP